MVLRLDTVGALFLLAIVTPWATAAESRPNILWISVEDIGPHLGCYGYEHAKTPTLDALARRGVRYDRAFATCPVCATNRSSIITGMYPTSIGTHHMRCRAVLPEGVRCFPELLRDAGYYCTNNSKTDYNLIDAGRPWDASSGSAHWRGRAKGQPFFAVFNLTNTHESKVWPRGKAHRKQTPDLTAADRQDPGQLTPPPYLPNTERTRRDWANYLENITQADYYAADLLEQLRNDGLEESTIVFFWSDHGAGLPRNKRWPYDSGLRVPLIVHVPPALRQAGQGAPVVDRQLVSFVDLAPTVLNLTGVAIPDHMEGRAFLGPGLSPQHDYAFSTRDRMDERIDLVRSVRDSRYRYVRNYMPWKPYAQWLEYAERNATMQELRRLDAAGELPAECRAFMEDRKPVEELYDLGADPHELNNLAIEPTPEHEQVLNRFRRVLADWQVDTGDLGWLPEPMLRQQEVMVGDCLQIARQPGAAEAAAAAWGLLAPATFDAQAFERAVAALRSDNAAVRFWAVKVLGERPLVRDASGRGRAADLLSRSMKDEAAVVRVAAAAAVAERDLQDGGQMAIGLLREELAGADPWVRHHAAIALDELADNSEATEHALRAALSDDNEYVVRVAQHALNRIESDRTPTAVP